MLMPLDNAVRFIGYAAGVVAAFAIVVALHYFFRRPVVLTLDDDGYRSRTRSTGGLFTGGWLDVEDVRVADDVLVFSLVDGGEQHMPLAFFGRDKMRLLHDINERLNAAHGYRRLEGDGGASSARPG
jgi:hypothetical protein